MTAIERIDAEIKKRGLSRRKLAIKAGIPPSTFQSAMERNNGWNYNMLVQLSAALGMSLDELLGLIQGKQKNESQGAERRTTVGANIRKVRKQQGLSMAELGGRIGITAAALSRYELGQRKIGIKTLLRIADALNVNPLSLYPEDERADAVIPYLAADSNALQRVTSALEEFQYDASEIPDEPDEKILARLRSGRIVHTENTAFWRDAVGLYGSPTCSECGGSAAVKTRFCPHCGARMENFVAEER